jgi:hypothetical protein
MADENDTIDVREAIESWRVEACIRSLEGDPAGAALWTRAADLFADILARDH